MNEIELTFLGTGTSVGVPMVGCRCRGCTSTDPRDRRMRSSVLLRWPERTVVIDTTPDFREQMLAHSVMDLDDVLFTHNHADHIHGLDDVRPICFLHDKEIDLYGDPRSLGYIEHHYDYIWHAPQKGGGLPRVRLFPITEAVELGGVSFLPVPVWHGKLPVYGYRFGDCAYISDVSDIPAESMALLGGLKTFIVDAVRYRPHTTHFHVEEAVEVARAVGAEQTYLTHMNHDILHAELAASLPEGIAPAHDGLSLTVHA